MIEYIAAAVILLAFLVLFWSLIKKLAVKASILLVNGLAGVLILFFLNHYLGWWIPVNLATVLVCALFGIPGVGALVVLHFFNMI
ncbi:MAG: sigmaK-factor processing regulatory BofA [Candidatus Altiarchaeales archaeon]|nr:sigmaK-factor processing regulatory BofA [Candidatus Altiarchaeales archaeon]MBD3416590.1 sigmaK-factor processing regulatory BofA [Candidatus Altiarchaeales archaeon]